MYLGNNAALLGCQEYFNRCAAAGSPIGGTQTPTAYDNAASFNGTNQFLSNASFTQGGSFTLAFWVNPRNANFNGILNKGFQNGTAYDWQVFTIGSTVYLQGGTPSQTVNVNRPLTLNQWSFVVVAYDSSTLVKSISVNNGVASSNTGTGAMANSFSSINFSFIYSGANSVEITAAGYWNRVLSPSEVTALFNSGAGRTYASLDSGLRNNLISWWALNQNSVTADSHTTGNNLTNSTNAVTAPNIGPVVTALSDPRQLIIDFAQGIDRLGLWNSMVCWPLRSSQNAASGTTAFSLGGLGQFDGTLVGTPLPIRTADGVTFGGNSQYIQYAPNFNVDFTKGGFSVYAVWSAMGVPITSGEGNFQLFGAFPNIEINNVITTLVGGGATWQAQSRNYNGNRYLCGNQQPTLGNAAYGWNADTLTIQRDGVNGLNGNVLSFATTNGAYTLRTTGRNNSTTSATSRVSHLIAMAPGIGMTASRMAQIHALYRQTLGLGLGLP